MTKCIVFDVETIADPRIIDDPERCEAVFQAAKAPSNWKDEAKILAHKHEAVEKWRAKAALNPCASKVCAIAIGDLAGGNVIESVSLKQEARVLHWFVRHLSKHDRAVLGGHNIRKFDVPLITLRCGVHRIDLPGWWPDAGEYTHAMADTFDLLPHSVADLADAHKLPPKLATGADVAKMDAKTLRAYVHRDVLIERRLLRIHRNRFRALRGEYR